MFRRIGGRWGNAWQLFLTASRYRKVFAGILLASALVLSIPALLLPRLFDPGSYRTRIISLAEKSLNRQVSYDDASFSWGLGPSFTFRKLVIKETSGETSLLEADRLTFNLALFPMLRKEIILRDVVLDSPKLNIKRDAAGVTSIADLFTGKPGEFKVNLKGLHISKGRIRFTDHFNITEAVTITLEDLDLSIQNPNRGEKASLKITAHLAGNGNRARLGISGTAAIPAEDRPLAETAVDMTVSSQGLDLGRYWPLYGRFLPVDKLGGELDLTGEFKGTLAEFTSTGRIDLKDLRLDYPRAFSSTLSPKKVSLSYQAKLTPRDLALAASDFTIDGFRLNGNCTISDIHSPDPHISARGSTTSFRLKEIDRFIPYGIIPTGTGDFIRKQITAGVFKLDEVRIDGRVSQLGRLGQGDNYKTLSVRGRVDNGTLNLGPDIPAISNISGRLELNGKDFFLRGMSGKFGNSPLTLDGTIAGFSLDTPTSYPFTMSMEPGEAEISWLLHDDKSRQLAYRGRSTLKITGEGTTADYRLTGMWDLSRADYRYRQLIHKPAGLPNRIGFTARLEEDAARLSAVRYELPDLTVTANATYYYSQRERPSLTFAATTNRFEVNSNLAVFPSLGRYQPSGTMQATISGSGDPKSPGLQGAVALTEFSFRPRETMPPLRSVNGTILLTGTSLETTRLAGMLGDSQFTISGRQTGFSGPSAELSFSSPGLHLKDVGFDSPGEELAIKNLAGAISLQGDGLNITSLSGEIGQSKFNLSGNLPDFGKPHLNLQIAWPALRVEDILPFARLTGNGDTSDQTGVASIKAQVTVDKGSFQDLSFEKLATALTLQNNRLTVHDARAGVFGGTVTANGEADFTAGDMPTYTASYGADHLDMELVQKAAGVSPLATGTVTGKGELSARGSRAEALLASARGKVAVTLADGMVLLPNGNGTGKGGKFPFKTIQAQLSYDRQVLTLQSARIDAFGGLITGTGSADLKDPDGPAYLLRFQLRELEALPFLTAVGVPRELSGRLTLQGALSAKGDSGENLKKTLNGPVVLNLEKGVIYKVPIISKVFSLLNVSQLLDFRLPDLISTGMPYNRINGNFAIHDGSVATSDLSVQSSSINMTLIGKADLVKEDMDATIGVQPLQTFGKIISRIPVLGWLLTGKSRDVLVVYYTAKGPWANPTVTSTSTAALSKGVVDIFKRIYNLPEELISDPGRVILGN